MKKTLLFCLILFLFFSNNLTAQVCTTLGQNPETAFPVCGTASFSQLSVPICGGRTVPSRCNGTLFEDKNPFWYRFTCFTSGTLGFVITPTSLSDDYDWQLFDITNRNPQEIYTNAGLFVACNWSGEGGLTGASSAGTTLVRCEGPGVPLFSSMPALVAGRTYLLLVSHFTDTQIGYSLSFGGGTASITDPVEPHLKTASAACDGTTVRIKLNKKMKCKSLAANGSDFSINTTGTSIINAEGIGCSTSFDMDSVVLTLTNPLAPGNYTLTVGNGSDANTLQDNCDRLIPVAENIPLTVFPIIPTPMDSLTKIGCAPNSLQLIFRKPILCNSIAADGSDFIITGPAAVTVTGATGTCVNVVSSSIAVQLSAPLQVGGSYTIQLQNGSDGNTIIDECGQQTPAGSAITFVVSDTVNANFTFAIVYGCSQNTIQYNHSGNNNVNSWVWNFDNSRTSNLQNPFVTYTDFREKKTTLIVSNGVCKDTASVPVIFDNLLNASFKGTALVCPDDPAVFTDQSEGKIISWEWSFGNLNRVNVQNPPSQFFPVSNTTRDERVQLIIRNSYGCADTATQNIKVINNCYIAVPSAFTPNGDGMNDFLYPLNAYKANDLSFSVYNRFGQRVFFTKDWTNKWDGKIKGQGADTGAYVWILTYINSDTNLKVEQKGTTILIR